jgi:valyl-tRNA synthetase
MALNKIYNPGEVEEKWFKFWDDNDQFSSYPNDKKPYTIVIPPPNVTGILHMGHMLNNTIQDILIRKARLDGMNACWVPGTDHASIATYIFFGTILMARYLRYLFFQLHNHITLLLQDHTQLYHTSCPKK